MSKNELFDKTFNNNKTINKTFNNFIASSMLGRVIVDYYAISIYNN